MKNYITLTLLLLFSCLISAQTKLSGTITDTNNTPIPYVSVYIKGGVQGTTTNENGVYELEIPLGKQTIKISSQGFRKITKKISAKNKAIIIDFQLIEDVLGLDEVVVTATRNRVEKRTAPVVVSTLKTRLLKATQSLSVADGLNYAPGVRVETNCQNCGFTDVRLNGLAGGYTQILVNSRPVFSSLIGVYGLEQIPTSIIERIEVVRGGGSSLYGSSAIAGTVNVITKDPIINTWEIGTNFALIDGKTTDKNLTLNNSLVSDDLNSGISVFGVYRNRDSYDANNDGFTEITVLKNNTLGAKAFVKPTEKSKISINLNAIQEYRRGGDRLNLAPHFTDITEELNHDTFIGGANYELYSKDDSGKFQIYTSASYTDRDSYYGGLGGARTRQDSITATNAYGKTKDLAWVNGLQYTKSLKNKDVITAGIEYNHSNTEDQIAGYNRIIDQTVNTLGTYVQYEWKPTDKFTALLGGRLDNISVKGAYTIENINRSANVNQTVFSPRLTASYQFTKRLKFRAGYARGFRTPQAYNEDFHIANVGGEQQFLILSDNLKSEFSNAYTASFNYSKTKGLLQMDFLLEGFYTSLENPFINVSTGASLANGSILEEIRNGSGAKVYGANFEVGISPNPKWKFQLGGTVQNSKYKTSEVLFESDGTVSGESNVIINNFIRTPDIYGYFNTSWIPNKKFNIDLTGTYTGSMIVPLIVSDSGFLQLNNSPSFFDLNLKLEKHIDFNENFMTTISAGVRNLFNAYQDDFQVGAGRDSGYIYGPNQPQTFFVGIKFGKFH